MRELFSLILTQPLFNGFVGIYNLVPDVGFVILLLTIIIKALLYPLTSSSLKSQKALTELQPKLDELKKKHKDNQQMMAQETMKLYKEHKVNPLGSCLPILLQIPVFIALYYVMQAGLTGDNFDNLYSFIPSPGHINTKTLGLVDLKNPSIILAVLAGAAQFWQARMMMHKPKPPVEVGKEGKDENMMATMNKQMMYMMPIMTVIIGVNLPGGLSLYWLLSTVLTGLQQKFLFKKKDDGNKPTPPGVIEGQIIDSK